MIHFGFSYIGLIFLLMLFIPNILWTKHQPKDYEKYVGNENKILLMLERTGEIFVSCIALIFSDFNLREFNLWSIWLLLAVVAFFFLGIYGTNLLMIFATIVLGIGHIGIHLAHRGEILVEEKKKEKTHDL